MARTVHRAKDFKPPKRVPEDDFEEICFNAHIERADWAFVRDRLDEAARAFGEYIIEEDSRPSWKDDRDDLESAINAIKRARARLKRCGLGKAGKQGLRISASSLAPALSVNWMRDRFPERDPPNPIYLPTLDESAGNPASPGPGRTLSRRSVRQVDTDSLSLEQRILFMRHCGPEAILRLVQDLEYALESGLGAIVQLPTRTGRTPIEVRRYMLAALAEVWHQLGRRPTSGARSKYLSFCENVFKSIGWPENGVDAAVPDAINLWRDRYGRELAKRAAKKTLGLTDWPLLGRRTGDAWVATATRATDDLKYLHFCFCASRYRRRPFAARSCRRRS